MVNDNERLKQIRMIDLIMEIRNKFRIEKDYVLSDKYKKGLEALGIEVRDAKDGTATWKYKE